MEMTNIVKTAKIVETTNRANTFGIGSPAITIGALVSDVACGFSKFDDSKMQISLDGLPLGDLGILRDFC